MTELEQEYAAHVAASNEANDRAIADNRAATATLKHKRLMTDLSAGLRSCVNSGLDRASIHSLVDAVFDEAGLA